MSDVSALANVYRSCTNHEFIVPLVPGLATKNVFEAQDRFPALLFPTYSIRPILQAEDVRTVLVDG